jgi:sensor histidine kinase YesM
LFLLALFTSFPLCIGWGGSYRALLARLLIAGLLLLLVFAAFERHPAKLPEWLERWVLQVAAVALAVPFAVGVAYMFTSWGYTTSFGHDVKRQMGYAMIVGAGLLVAPWAALAALFRQVSGQARNRELAFALERSQLERQALHARVRLLQAQVEPHFLFNTLANVRELVDSGSPQASAVLESLIAYLRAAVPRLDAEAATLGQELELVRAYLEVMQMRIPDRLQFLVQADPALHALRFPAMALLTLVENAVRHGIDPAEEGGRIEVRVRRDAAQLHVQVLDTGVGLRAGSEAGGGTGLANLRERLLLLYRGRATLVLLPLSPHGTSAEIALPLEAEPAS